MDSEGLWKKLSSPSEFFLIAGPCVMESLELMAEVASVLKNVCEKLRVTYIFKSSYDKANRTSITSFRGPGIQKGLVWLKKIKDEFSVPVLTDVHSPQEAEMASEVTDILQVPAFLCRQTDLLVSVAKTGKIVNVKKGQFLAPWDMENVIKKVQSANNKRILVTERGSCFGYNNLVVDMRAIPIMKKFGFPVVFDATHSVQKPGGLSSCSGGDREFVPHLARAAVACGADGLFLEVHPMPDKALCDGPNSYFLDRVNDLLKELLEIFQVVRKQGRDL